MTAPPLEEIGTWRVVLRSFATLLTGEAAARLLGLVAILVLARRLGPHDYGIVAFAIALVGWFGIVVDSGTETLTVRDIARDPSRFRHIAERVLGLRLAISVVATGAFVAGVELFAHGRVRDTVVLFAVALPAIALNPRWMVLGIREARAIAVGNICARAVLAAGALLLVHSGADLRRVPFVQATSEVVYAATILAIVGRRFGLVRPRIDVPAWISTLRQSAPLFVNGVARAAYYSFDVIAVELLLGPKQAGIYSVGTKPALFFAGAFGLFSISFLSSFSAASAQAPEAARELMRHAVKLTSVVSFPLAGALSLAAVVIVPAAFGDSYRAATAVLAVAAWGIPLTGLGVPYSSVLIAAGRQADVMRNHVLAACVLIVADLILIPVVGIVGAAAVAAGSAGLGSWLNFRSCKRAGGAVFGRLPDIEGAAA